MYLKKFDFIQNNKNNKLSFRNLHPFSAFKTSKMKNEFLEQINKYQEKENNCMSLFGIDLSNINKNNDRNKRNENSYEKSMSSSSISKSLKNILYLKNANEKNSLPIRNQMNINLDLFPQFQRNVKKFKTNLSINTNNINNNLINNFLLTNIFENKSKKDLNNLNKSPFITDIIGKNSNIFNYTSNSEKNIFKISGLLKQKKYKNNIELNKSSNFNNQFSNELTSINNNSQKTLSFQKPFLFNNRIGKKYSSNKTINNMKSLSIIKSPLNKRKKSNIFHSFSANKFFTYKNNSNKKNTNKNNYLSLQSNLSLSEEMKSSLDQKKTNHKKDFIKTYYKQFKSMIKNKLFDLEEGINNETKEQEKTEEEYNLYIKYMIKKCKYIYNIIDKNISIKIPESYYSIQKQDKAKLIDSKTYNKNNKNREFFRLKEKLKENEHKIFRLLNTYYSSKRKINYIIGKLIEINKNKKKK